MRIISGPKNSRGTKKVARPPVTGFRPIEDYFLIGDLRTAALVSLDGSIDWLCLPYFDSPSIFGRLVDPAAGQFSLDMPGYTIRSAYLNNTAIVESQVSNGKTKLSIQDFMVPEETSEETARYLVRRISARQGSAEVKFTYHPRPNYGSQTAALKIDGQKVILGMESGSLILHTPKIARLKLKDGICLVSIALKTGDNEELILEYLPAGSKPMQRTSEPSNTTREFWLSWVAKGRYVDFCRQDLIRSAITLKLLQFYPTGAIVAAPTTSLPEEIGGSRNWDYRYSWIRDATFSLYAFKILGYEAEAERFFDFISLVTDQCVEQDFDVSLMYTIWGQAVPSEDSLKHLAGYKGSRPVRVGNDATWQFQLDVYGVLIDAIYFATKENLTDETRAQRRKWVVGLVRKIGDLWQSPDYGIWEARTGVAQYTYSRVMAWVGVERAGRLAKSLDIEREDLIRCADLASEIREWIWSNCFDNKRKTFVQQPRTRATDATNFLFVLLQFLDKHDPLTRMIVDNTREKLVRNKVFVYRYRSPDGVAGGEGAFLLCSFWLISALAIIEDVDEALSLFQQLSTYFKPSGLLPEELNPDSGEFLGNYPQAFSHQGYIMSAHYIHKYKQRQAAGSEQPLMKEDKG